LDDFAALRLFDKAAREIATSRRDFRVALNCKLVVAFTASTGLKCWEDFIDQFLHFADSNVVPNSLILL
jgi:hypothetical protein